MRFCWNCGSTVEDHIIFCSNCGANVDPTLRANTEQPNTKQTVIGDQEPQQNVNPIEEKKRTKPGRGSTLNKNPIYYIITGLLVVALITLGIFYGQCVNKLNTANAQIAELTANIATLENNIATLQTQLATEEANVASLQTQLTDAINDLNSSNAQITQLQLNLNTSELQVTNLRADLIQLQSDLTNAETLYTNLSTELTIVTYPRHFNSLEELETWLANDDTNTNTAYSSLTAQARSYVLQVKALRDGYLLSACLDWDSSYVYSWNIAVVNGTIYSVDAATDSITQGPTLTDSLPLQPLSQP